MGVYPPVEPESGMNFTKKIYRDTYPAIAPSQSNCKGKSVYITGASKGIGFGLALAYATAGASKMGLGARSLPPTIHSEILAAAKKAGHSAPQILKHKLDVTDPCSVAEAAKSTEKEFGHLDILINNAGYLEDFKKMCDGDEKEYWRTWEINIRGVYWVSKAMIPLLLKGGDRTVVNVSSIGAHKLTPGASGYETTKFALLRFTEYLNVDYGDQGLLAYSVHPGGIPTELAKGMQNDAVLVDTVELASDTIVFLTQEKREWLAGRYISCTWDMTELLSREKEIVEGDKLKMRMVW